MPDATGGAEDGAGRWGEVRIARFTPTRPDNLRPAALPLIGQVREWEYTGTMDEGPYDGQVIWTLPRDLDPTWIGWVPDEDLTTVIPPGSSDPSEGP